MTVRDYLCGVLGILDTLRIHGIAVHLVHVLVLATHADAIGVILPEYFLILVCHGFEIRIVGCLVHVIVRQVDLIGLVFKDATRGIDDVLGPDHLLRRLLPALHLFSVLLG